jgi:S-adenosylmethionine:tRNA ribosyltransferase-isomerase
VLRREDDMFVLRFSHPLAAFLAEYGEVPLPPYLHRAEETADSERYQTVYADLPGAVAAPTAGLHFDSEMMAETRTLGVQHAFVTLHVGAGTFLPLREEQISANRLHNERVDVNEKTCRAVLETRARGGRVIAIGTTSVRALEAASANGNIEPFCGETDIFIVPGYRFRSVDTLLTNFHLARSSLLMLVAAFAGRDRIMSAYRHAIKERYRFFSYGDAMLISQAQE